ncbi:serine/threonine-protein kinase-like protein [Citrus sinensis]|uniref:Serine/threonine-protein kinase-like protein n=1 Tax=Citrus sinensis TaxID=2711 RepID=A0ACB8K9V2_CITSI|nr:serine/threonine-protein kinase-like protein [Citrus sinensis]
MAENFDYEELVKATESFSQSRLIGKGSHGSVYKAILEDHQTDGDHKILAIKRASTNGFEVLQDNSKKLNNEIRVLSSLQESNKRNPNYCVVNFHGTSCRNSGSVDGNSNKLLVMEFMPNGSLYDLLHNAAAATTPQLGWPNRVKIAMQISRAIQCLHENDPMIIHRDIKSTNILFDSKWDAKLADFGLAVSESDESSMVQPAGTIGYLDPGYTNPSKLSKKVDVFSYGVVLLEIISCRKPIDAARDPASIIDWALPLIKEEKLRQVCDSRVGLPTFMEGAIKQMLHVAARCVSSEEENRPGIGEILMGCSCFFVDHHHHHHHHVERVRSIPLWIMSLWGSTKIRQKKGANNKFPCSQKKMMILREILAVIELKKLLSH